MKQKIFLSFLIISCLFYSIAVAKNKNIQNEITPSTSQPYVGLYAGTSKINITPPIGTPLAGFGDRQGLPSKGVHDNLYARAVVLTNGEEKFAFVAVDTLLIRREFYEKVSNEIEKLTGIPFGNTIISASHTHSGSGAIFKELIFLAGLFNQKIRDAFEKNIIQVVVDANKKLQPAKIGFGVGEAPLGNGNRRAGSYKIPPVDSMVGVIRIDDLQDNPLAIIYNFTAHPTILNTFYFSADFPGAASKALENVYPNAVALFINDAQGNQGPGNPFNADNDLTRMQGLGYYLAGEVLKIANTIKTTPQTKIIILNQKIILNKKLNLATQIQVVVINNNALVSMPGEAFAEIGLAIKEKGKQLGFTNTFLWGLTNDGLGYIMPEPLYHTHGYETMISLFGAKFGDFLQEKEFILLELAKKKTQ